MKKTFHILLTGLTLVAVLAGSALAEDVYITRHGRTYHKADSRYVIGRKDVVKMTRKEAEAKGYKPGREFRAQKVRKTKKVSSVK